MEANTVIVATADQLNDRITNAVLKAVADAFQRHSITPIQPEAPDELLTPGEAAQALRVSKVTVWDWSRRGILNPRRIGNQVRYLRSEILAAARPKGSTP